MRFMLLSGAFLLSAAASAALPEASPSKHWSLRPPQRPAVPRFEGPGQRAWVRNPVDAFILERHYREDLRPVLEADRGTLIRRLTFDLTGLPPTPEEVAEVLSDPSPYAYEKLVERLLASPRYGERWGRHWLDVVRYAETEGFEYDRHRPDAWRFRDYVIDSFNRDKPYDRFVMEQLAGDEIDPQSKDLLVAAGFHRLGPVRRNAGNQELAFSRHEVITEMTDIVGSAFLALTVGCARCHDHKFDDISQADYFRLQAFMAAAQEQDVTLSGVQEQAGWKAKSDKVQREMRQLQRSLTKLTGQERQQVEEKISALEKSVPPPLPVIATVRNAEPQRTPIHILKRGNTDRKEQQVGPRFLGALVPTNSPELPPETPRPRTLLAHWIASPDNPLTARVMVNRIWQYHFGRGLVDTANDFGVNGSLPSHPDLLDWLASEFVAGEWRIKPIHRLLVMSSSYRQASHGSGLGPEKESDNRLLWHFSRRRLTAEEIRDAMLVVSGRLNNAAGGPSVVVPVAADLVGLLYAPTQWTVTRDQSEHDRRSVYLLAKRNLRLPFMEVFDQPDAQLSSASRESSTHSLQALELLNGQLANDLAESFAERLVREVGADPVRQVEWAYLLAAGRPPHAREKELARAFLKNRSLKEFALAVLNLNAFLYVD